MGKGRRNKKQRNMNKKKKNKKRKGGGNGSPRDRWDCSALRMDHRPHCAAGRRLSRTTWCVRLSHARCARYHARQAVEAAGLHG